MGGSLQQVCVLRAGKCSPQGPSRCLASSPAWSQEEGLFHTLTRARAQLFEGLLSILIALAWCLVEREREREPYRWQN